MKLFLMTFIASLLTFFSCGAGNKAADNKTPANTLKSYGYSEHGSMAQSDLEFKVERVDDNKCRVIYFNRDRTDYNDQEERDTVLAPTSLLKDIEKIVTEHNMCKYDKHYNTKFDVMDGTSWSMSISFMDDTSFCSYGYMAWPHDDGIKIIVDMMRKRFKGL